VADHLVYEQDLNSFLKALVSDKIAMKAMKIFIDGNNILKI
jgi:hypothetical protein